MRFKNKLYAVDNGDEYYELTREEICEMLNITSQEISDIVRRKKVCNGYTIKQIRDVYEALLDGKVFATASNWYDLGVKLGYNPEVLAKTYREGKVLSGKYILNRYQLTRTRTQEKPNDLFINAKNMHHIERIIDFMTNVQSFETSGNLYYSNGNQISEDDIKVCLDTLKKFLESGKVIILND